MDLVKIANACAVECVRQKTGLTEVHYLIKAYTFVQNLGLNTIHLFELMGETVEPLMNQTGFRTTVVTFANGGSSCPPSEIPRKMDDLVQDILYYEKNPASREWVAGMLTREFLWIHPFRDGNGRIGFLLYNYLMGTLDEPLALPDFQW